MTYKACPIKRARRTKAEIGALKEAMHATIETDSPMTVRQVFYQLVTAGIIEKTEAAYQQIVVRLLTEMRLAGELPYDWIVDHSRHRRITKTYSSIGDAARNTAKFYRRSALDDAPAYIEIWVEKEALTGVLSDVTVDYDVPLLASKGMPSLTFLHVTACHILAQAEYAARPTFIYQFGDHDPTGVLIPQTIERRLREMTDGADFTVERVALTEAQIAKHKLPTRPTKRDGNRHAKGFDGDSVELDALPPSVLKAMARAVIERHISSDALDKLRTAEASERLLLRSWADRLEGRA